MCVVRADEEEKKTTKKKGHLCPIFVFNGFVEYNKPMEKKTNHFCVWFIWEMKKQRDLHAFNDDDSRFKKKSSKCWRWEDQKSFARAEKLREPTN